MIEPRDISQATRFITGAMDDTAKALAEINAQTLRLREAIDDAAKASNKQASRLFWVTLALVLATIALTAAAVAQAYFTYLQATGRCP
jgi:hypothetical protein